MSIKQNNANVVTACTKRITGLAKYVKTKTAITIEGQPMKLNDVISVYQASLDTRAAVDSARAVYEKALEARDAAEESRLSLDTGLKAWVASSFGATSQVAKELGFLPPKVGVKSAATKAQAVEKQLATRKARGTGGKRQKAHIKGTIDDAGKPAPPTDPGAPTATNGASKDAPPSDGASASH
jgi:hypothetical protein